MSAGHNFLTKRKEMKTTPTPQQLAASWIKQLQDAGYSYDDMLAVFAEARRKYEEYKKRKEKN